MDKVKYTDHFWLKKADMVNTCESWIPLSPDLDKVTVSFDKLNNTDLFLQVQYVYKVYTFIKGTQD